MIPALLSLRWLRIGILLAALAALGAGLWYVHNHGVEQGRADVQASWDAVKLAQAQADLEQELRNNLREKAMQATADDLRKAKDVEIAKLNRSLTTALDGLRNRPERPDPGIVPEDSSVGAGCYPAQLYREDASVVIKLAGEADQLRISLGQCQAQYNEVKRVGDLLLHAPP